MTTTFQTTQLDFSNIKESLKAYLRQQPEFADYDFEAAGINNILDVLAYNTHFNALMANFSLNEAYLTSAQLRSSVISIAQSLGYNVRSRTASIAYVGLSLNLAAAPIKPTSITIPAGTRFNTAVDGVAYTFQTREDYTAINDGTGFYVFLSQTGSEDIPIYEGISRTKTFIVQESDENQIFVIPDETIDTSQMIVRVYPSYGSTEFTSYTDIVYGIAILPTSTYYRTVESPNGFYEIHFGDGKITGLRPGVGAKVEVNYLSCVGPAANSARTFTPVSQVSVNNVNYPLSVSVRAQSSGGANRQSIESIRANAPLTFAAQRRLVTAEDYKTVILTNFSTVRDAVAWGGEDNDPPKYGVVYVGLLFDDNVPQNTKDAVKSAIINVFNENLGVLSIDAEIVDPVISYLEINTSFNYNPNLTGLTQNSLRTLVRNNIQDYVDENLKRFGQSFRKSNLMTKIDEINDAILSSEITVKIQQRLTPVTVATDQNPSASRSYTIFYPVELAEPDDEIRIIVSSNFVFNGEVAAVKNKLGRTKLQIVNVDDVVLIDNIGSYDPLTGKINLVGFAPGTILSGESFIKFTAIPRNDSTIKPLRNYYLDIDNSVSVVSSVVDAPSIRVNL